LILSIISKTHMYPLKLLLVVPIWLLRSPPIKSFHYKTLYLTMSLKSSQNYFLTSLLKPTYGTYALITFKMKSPIANLTMMIMSPCLITTLTPFLRLYELRYLRHFCFILSCIWQCGVVLPLKFIIPDSTLVWSQAYDLRSV
jgi:hypothetical protein